MTTHATVDAFPGLAPEADAGASATPAVSRTDLHNSTKDALERVRDVECLVVTHYNSVDAYLVSPGRMRDMATRIASADEREREIQATLPLILAAARAGVAIPSESLDRIAPGLDDSWQAIAEFAAAFPLRLSRGEHGEPLTRGTLRAAAAPVYESGDDDELNSDV